MRLAEHVVRIGDKGMHKGFGWEKRPQGRHRRGYNDNIKMDLREIVGWYRLGCSDSG
jgi:hypothetical protein